MGCNRSMIKYVFFLVSICSCNNETVRTDVYPRRFKVEFKHDKYASEIILPVTFGDGKKKYLLQFDNHSPSWVNGEVIGEVSAIRKTDNTYYKTSVADGRQIEGDVYVCDTVSIGGVKFNDVLFYKINDTARLVKGVIGGDIISHGVWVIDFEYNKVVFTSSMDSLERRYKYELRTLPTIFRNNNFIIEPEFSNGTKKQFEVDLGFNGSVLLPLSEFEKIKISERSGDHTVAFSTPGGRQIIKNYISSQKILLGTDSVFMFYSSNEKVVESVVGLEFFRQFAFVILDYPNRQLYVSRYR